MTKLDFKTIFAYDSATEAHCSMVAESYKAAAREAIKNAGMTVLSIASTNPNVELDWSFTPAKETKIEKTE